MRSILTLLGFDAADRDKAAEVAASLTTGAATMRAATAYAATLVGSIVAIGLLIDIASHTQ